MRARGVTLLETLIAMTVVAVALLALARLQAGMALGADVARARTEATQHARAALEGLRARAFSDLADGADAPDAASNTAFQRSWTVQGQATDPYRVVVVEVRWVDRRGTGESVTLRTVLARADPADGGSLAVAPPDADPWWRPMARHRSVPLDAVPLNGVDRGRSAAAWSGPSGGFLVFDNATGGVVAHCAALPEPGAGTAAACTPRVAYLLQGYIEGRASDAPRVVLDRLAHVMGEPECAVDDAVHAQTGQPITGFKRYRCLVQPTDHDGNPATPRVWSGRALVDGVGGAPVCRYTPDASTTINEHHPETYTLVDGSLDHQNFVIAATGDCPRGSVPHPAA